MELSILYRGNLSSCNYDCWYCPFAKRDESTRDLVRDRNDLERFVSWLEARAEDRLSVLFTPWGEALVRPWYRAALVRLSKLPQIGRVAIQTNLSCELEWLEDCELGRLAFWISFHPSQVSRDSFIEKCMRLHRRGVRFSVGIVGLRENGGKRQHCVTHCRRMFTSG